MLPEMMTTFTHPGNGIQYKLDVNNGFLYDMKSGAQMGKLAVKDDSKSLDRCRSVNAWAFNRQYGPKGLIATPIREAHELTAGFKSGGQDISAQILAARGFDQDKVVTMDLAVGDVHQPAPLPNYSAGYKNAAPLADMYAPPLLVEQISGKYYTWDVKDAFQPAVSLFGHQQANVGRIQPRVANSTYSTVEFALGSFIPTTLEAAADAALKIRISAARRVMNALLIGREQRVSVLATTSGSWNSNNVVTLGAGFQWNGGASSDPVKDLQARIEASLMPPTGIIMNERVWHDFVRNPGVQKYFTYKSNVSPIPQPTEMAALLELPPIYVSRMRWQTSNTPTFDYLWPDACVLVRHPESMPPVDQEDIASALTFRWNAAMAAKAADVQSSAGGFTIREFYNQLEGTMGGTMIVIVMHDAEVQTSAYVGGLVLSTHQ